MSHFLTLVIGDEPDKQLAKYDENLELPMHLYMTKEQLISEKRKEIKKYKKNYYDVFLQDKDAYLANCRKEHADYIENEFPKHLNWTDEQMYEDAVKYYRMDIDDGSENIEIHEDGSVWRTYNNDAKWDWYQMGGRYAGRLKLKDISMYAPLFYPKIPEFYLKEELDYLKKLKAEGRCDQARIKDISNVEEISVFAVVKDGKWYERGKMGWFGVVTDEKDKDEWREQVKQLLVSLPPDTLLTMYDCHI